MYFSIKVANKYNVYRSFLDAIHVSMKIYAIFLRHPILRLEVYQFPIFPFFELNFRRAFICIAYISILVVFFTLLNAYPCDIFHSVLLAAKNQTVEQFFMHIVFQYLWKPRKQRRRNIGIAGYFRDRNSFTVHSSTIRKNSDFDDRLFVNALRLSQEWK